MATWRLQEALETAATENVIEFARRALDSAAVAVIVAAAEVMAHTNEAREDWAKLRAGTRPSEKIDEQVQVMVLELIAATMCSTAR